MISTRRAVLYGASLALHVGVAAGFASIPKEKRREVTAITMASPKKKAAPPKPAAPPEAPKPPPPEKSPARSQRRARAAPAEAKPQAQPAHAASPSPLGGAADFGLSMTGGTGSGGMAIPAGNSGAAAEAPPSSQQAPKKLTQQAARPAGDDCDERPVKPKPRTMSQPAYTERARAAKVEGRVRVEITVDEQGRVSSARVVAGLGHGLDEAALAAARQMTFQPGTRCGKPSRSTFVVSMKFVLGS
jgi:periplasmic protein TonB